MQVEKQNRVFKKILTPLGFLFERKTKHGERWKHPVKLVYFQMSGSPSGNSWFDDAKRQFQKLISSNFDNDELNELLKPLLRKNKVKFNKQGKLRVLRIEGDFETNLLRDLLIPEYNEEDEMDIDDDDFEFSDELKTKIKLFQSMGFALGVKEFAKKKKDERKTKIED